MNLFRQATRIIYHVNDSENNFVKYYTCRNLKKCQQNLTNFYLTDLAKKVLVTLVNRLNFGISFELLRV